MQVRELLGREGGNEEAARAREDMRLVNTEGRTGAGAGDGGGKAKPDKYTRRSSSRPKRGSTEGGKRAGGRREREEKIRIYRPSGMADCAAS